MLPIPIVDKQSRSRKRPCEAARRRLDSVASRPPDGATDQLDEGDAARARQYLLLSFLLAHPPDAATLSLTGFLNDRACAIAGRSPAHDERPIADGVAILCQDDHAEAFFTAILRHGPNVPSRLECAGATGFCGMRPTSQNERNAFAPS